MKGSARATNLLEELRGQVDGAELYDLRRFELPVRFSFGALESVKSVEASGRALRVIKNGRLGFSTTTDLTDSKMLVHNALESAQFGDPAPFQFPAKLPSEPVLCFDQQVAQLTEEALIALGEEVIEAVKAYDARLQIDVSISKEIEEISLLNTSGLEFEERRTSLDLSVEAKRVREGDILIIYDSASSRKKQRVNGLALARRIIERFQWAEKIAKVESKPTPVIFNLSGAVVLLLPLMLGLSGWQVYLGASPLSEKLGQKVFDSRFTITDDGRLDFALRAASYDDEGVPTTTKNLVKGGVVQQFLYDLKTAGLAKTRPTGNGFKSSLFGRGFLNLPHAAPSTWLIPPGEQSLTEILCSLPEALFVEQVIGLGQGNVTAGEFSNSISVGFLVQKGEIVGRVKNTMIAGNVYELLRERLIAFSDHPEWVLEALHVPAIAVDGVSVVSKG